MTALQCEVRGVSRSLPLRTAECELDAAPLWAIQGPIGPHPLSSRALDLLDLAGAVYRVESRIKRRSKDPAIDWVITAPVREVAFWRETGAPLLASALGFLNRARWTWEFTERSAAPSLALPKAEQRTVADVLLFSGGMDSLCGAGVHAAPRARVALVSFYHKQAALQAELAKGLGYASPTQWRLAGHRGKEGMNLVRSFMFLCLGAVVAETYGATALYQYENGVLGTAVPPAGNFIPTRHAHPETHRRMQALLGAVFDREIPIRNPFLGLTKREAGAKLIGAVGQERAEALLRRTETCWYAVQPRVGGVPKSPWQPCGACTPCVVRRTARPDEAAAGAWPDWKGYAFDLRASRWQDHPRLGLSFRGYLELIDIVLTAPDDASLIRELAPEARALVGGVSGPSGAQVAQVLRRFAREFCETFGIQPHSSGP